MPLAPLDHLLETALASANRPLVLLPSISRPEEDEVRGIGGLEEPYGLDTDLMVTRVKGGCPQLGMAASVPPRCQGCGWFKGRHLGTEHVAPIEQHQRINKEQYEQLSGIKIHCGYCGSSTCQQKFKKCRCSQNLISLVPYGYFMVKQSSLAETF